MKCKYCNNDSVGMYCNLNCKAKYYYHSKSEYRKNKNLLSSKRRRETTIDIKSIEPEILKVCSMCNVEKNYRNEFYHNKAKSSVCKSCKSKLNASNVGVWKSISQLTKEDIEKLKLLRR